MQFSAFFNTKRGKWIAKYVDADGNQTSETIGSTEEDHKQALEIVEKWRNYHKLRNNKSTESEHIQEVPASIVRQDNSQHIESNNYSDITLKMLCDEYANHLKVNGKTENHIDSMMHVAQKWFYSGFGENSLIKDLDYGKHILPFFTKLKETISPQTGNKLSPVTVNKYVDILNIFLNYAVKRGYIDKNPANLLEKQHITKKHRELTIEDLQKIIKNSPEHLAWALEVAYNTGTRTGESELLSLKWSDVDFDQGQIHIYASKTKTERWLPLKPEFLEKLQYMKSISNCEYIVSYNDKKVSRLTKSFKTACKKAGIEYEVRMYDVRHLFASVLCRAGISVGEVSRSIGHSRVSTTTDVYYEFLPKEMFKIKDKLPDLDLNN